MTKLTSSSPVWQKVRPSVYALAEDGVVLATVFKTSESWLSHIDRPDDDGWHAVDFCTLAEAKAAMLRWWHERPRPVAIATPNGRRHRAFLLLSG